MAIIKHGAGATSAFKTVKVSGQSDVVADAGSDDLTLAAGSNVTITTNASTDTVTIASSGGAALAGIDDQSSSNDDQITITDTAVIINEDSDDCDFRVESNDSTHMLFVDGGGNTVGVGCTPAEAASNNPSALLMVSNRGTPSTPAEYSPLVVENDAAAAYVNVISNDNGWQGILFGDQTDPDEASIKYNSNNKRMYITGNAEAVASNVVTIDHSANKVGINVGAPAAGALDVDGGLALKQGSSPGTTSTHAKIFAVDDGDPSFNTDIKLYCKFNSSIADDSSYSGSFTTGGSPVIDTSVKKYGAGSLKFIRADSDTATTTSQFAAIKDYSGALTWDFWVRFNTVSTRMGILSSSHNDNFALELNSSNKFVPGYRESGGQYWNVTGDKSDFTTGVWYHFAFVKHANHNMYTFIDGVLDGSNTSSKTGAYVSTSTGTVLGKFSTHHFDGYLDQVRFTSYARWDGSSASIGDTVFTPPAGEDLGEAAMCWVVDGSGNNTKISPHNGDGDWEYYSKNTKTGQVVRINMMDVVKDLEGLTGKNYIKDE